MRDQRSSSSLSSPGAFGVALGAGVLVAVLLVSLPARAQQDDWTGGFDAEKAKRRSDVTFGVAASGAMAQIQAFPNEGDKIGDSRFEADTGAAAGYNFKLWLGGALADWLTFGIGVGVTSVSGNDLDAGSTAVLFRVETFPLFYQGGVFEDLGIYGDFGAGSMKVKNQDQETVGDSGALSIIGLGVLWEPLQFSKFSAGPFLEYQRLFSLSLDGHAGFLGFRLAFYGGPTPPERGPDLQDYPYHPSVAPVRPGPQPSGPGAQE